MWVKLIKETNMQTSKEKRLEYWCHFIEQWALDKSVDNGITSARLRKAKPIVINDDIFWRDIIDRHNGNDKSPYMMQDEQPVIYRKIAFENYTALACR